MTTTDTHQAGPAGAEGEGPATAAAGPAPRTVTAYLTQTTPVVLQVDTIDLDAPGARAAVERALISWLQAGGEDREDSDALTTGLEVYPGEAWTDPPLTVPVLDLPSGRHSGAGLVVSWAQRTHSDSAALDVLSGYLTVDEDGRPRRTWPGGADTLEVLGQVLESTGRPT